MFGFIPLGSKNSPVPPPLDTFFINAEGAQGGLHSYEVATPPGGQTRTAPAERWLELGDLSVGGIIDEQCRFGRLTIGGLPLECSRVRAAAATYRADRHAGTGRTERPAA